MGRLPFDLDLDDIAALADIINDRELGEIRLEDDDIGAKLVIKGRRPCPPPPPPQPYQAPMPMPVPMPDAKQPEAPLRTEKPADGNTVKAPVVGTYYASPSPDKPPFVQVGKKVRKGDIIMIIESMKIMNEVPSPYDGVVKEILAKNGDPVEYDQPIMIIG